MIIILNRQNLVKNRLNLSWNLDIYFLLLDSGEKTMKILSELLNSRSVWLLLRGDRIKDRLELRADVLQSGRLRWDLRLQLGQELLNWLSGLLELLSDLLEVWHLRQDLLDLLLADLLDVLCEVLELRCVLLLLLLDLLGRWNVRKDLRLELLDLLLELLL